MNRFTLLTLILCLLMSTAFGDWGAKDKQYLRDNGIVQGRGEGVDPLTEKDVSKAEVGIMADKVVKEERSHIGTRGLEHGTAQQVEQLALSSGFRYFLQKDPLLQFFLCQPLHWHPRSISPHTA